MIYGRKLIVSVLLLLSACLSILGQSTAFSYQGRLTDDAAAPNGTYQMQFALFDSLSGGTQVGATTENTAVPVQNGLFSVQLDFGSTPFSSGDDRYLEVRVRRNSGESYVALAPRHVLGRVPFAIQAFSGDEERARLLGAQRWDVLRGMTSYPLANARSIAFDGSSIWVSITNGTVTKIRPSDGQALGTFTVGSDPRGMATDGTNLWVANFGSNTVTKLRISDGAFQGTYTVGTNPVAVCFDGVNIWVANNGNASVTRLRASDGQFLNTFATGASPSSVFFDGSVIYIVSPTGTSRRLASDGSLLASVSGAPVLAYDGYNLWVPTGNSFDLNRLRTSDGAFLESLQITTVQSVPAVFQFDGKGLWIGFSNTATVVRLNPAAGQNSRVLASITLPRHPVFNTFAIPRSATFDGKNVWFVMGQSGGEYLTKVPAYP